MVSVAPDLEAVLKPVEGSKGENYRWSEMEGNLSVGEFKEVISKKWRRREGNEVEEVVNMVRMIERS